MPNEAYGIEGMPERLPVCPKEAPVKSSNFLALNDPGMRFSSNAAETIEVDFERKIALRHPEAKNNVFEHEVHKVEVMRNMTLTLGAKVGACLQVKLTDNCKEVHASFSANGPAFDLKYFQFLKWGTTRATKGP